MTIYGYDPTFLIVLICGVISMFVVSIVYLWKEGTRHKDILKKQAIKRNAELTGGFLSNPKLKLNYYTDKLEIYTFTHKFGSTTFLEIVFDPPVNLKMKIYKESNLAKVGKAIGMMDIQFGYDEFDSEVIVKGNDENYIRNIITFEIQQKILFVIKKKNIIINLKNDRLRITIPGLFKDEETTDELINLSLKLVDKIKGRMSF